MSSLKILVLFMAICRAGAAQNPYPMLSINQNGDTVVTLTMLQLKKINIQLLGLDECELVSESCEDALTSAISLSEEKSKQIRNFVDLTDRQAKIIKQDSALFQGQKKMITFYESLDKLHLQNEKSLKAKLTGFKIGTFVSIGGALALFLFLK
jgi:hypothetical protein